jgi:hypothetical protein
MINKAIQEKIGALIKATVDKKIQEVTNTGIWSEKPVSPKVFFTEWLKTPAYPIQQDAIDKILVEEVQTEDGVEYRWNTQYNEAYLLWGEGSGKDWTSSRLMAYAIYWLLCLKNPQQYFGFTDPKAPIDLINVSFDEDQAQNVFFKELKKALSSCINPKTGRKWFEEQGMKIKETSKSQMIEFPKYITAYSLNSREYKAEGKSVIMTIFDEMAVFKVAKADELYKNLKGSMYSRFPKEHKLIAISYKRDDYDYMMIRWEETKNNPKVFRSGPHATWEVNQRMTREDYNDAFEQNPEDAERRYQCLGSTIKEGYFKYSTKVREGVNKDRISPIIEEVIPEIDLLHIGYNDWFTGKEYVEYVVAIDLAKGKETETSQRPDCAGFAMGHKEIRNGDEEKPIVVIDMMFQIAARVRGGEIIFEDIRTLIFNLIKNRGFSIGKVTLDGYQSTDFMQQLRNKGIKSDLLSVDTSMGPYDTMKGLIYTGRLDYYMYPVFIRECEELKNVGGKVDHPEISRRRAKEENGNDKGSKDVSDAVAAVCASLLTVADKKPASGWVDMNGKDNEGVKETHESPDQMDSKMIVTADDEEDED